MFVQHLCQSTLCILMVFHNFDNNNNIKPDFSKACVERTDQKLGLSSSFKDLIGRNYVKFIWHMHGVRLLDYD